MWLNRIQGTFELKSINNLSDITDRTVKKLKQNRFIIEKKDNRITFQRSIQFSTNTGNNRWQIFLYNYDGVIETSNINGNNYNKYSLNINAQLFKQIILILFIGLFLYQFETHVNPLIYLGISVSFILIQRILIKDHFLDIVAQ
jgi:hypothetical protein